MDISVMDVDEKNNKRTCMTSDLPDNSLDSVIVLLFLLYFSFFPLPSSLRGDGVSWPSSS